MNKIPIFFLLFLVTSMAFVTTPNVAHADSQLDILIKIALNTKEHIKNDIDKVIGEIVAAEISERGARIDDKRSEAAMEKRKEVGYF